MPASKAGTWDIGISGLHTTSAYDLQGTWPLMKQQWVLDELIHTNIPQSFKNCARTLITPNYI